jgi:hypothetical protein
MIRCSYTHSSFRFLTGIRLGVWCGLFGFFVMICLGNSTALAQASVPAPAVPNPVTQSFANEAGKLGVRQCANLYAELGNLVSTGAASYKVRTVTDKAAPDAHVVQGVIGMTYDLPELKGQAAGIVISVPTRSGCEGQIVRVTPFQKPCSQMTGFLPAGSVLTDNLSNVALYQLGSNQGQALMIPSAASCVVVTFSDGRQGQ